MQLVQAEEGSDGLGASASGIGTLAFHAQARDDARLVAQIGREVDNAMEMARGHGIFLIDGCTCRLAQLAGRASRGGLGVDPNPPLIDTLQRGLLLWKEEKRRELVSYLSARDLMDDLPAAPGAAQAAPYESWRRRGSSRG